MPGFFTKAETESNSRPGGKTYSCISCGLYKHINSPKMRPFGDFKKQILIIGEFPGRAEDSSGIPFQGKTGRYLRSILKKSKIDLQRDCLTIYANKCYPKLQEDGKDKIPGAYEIACCRTKVLNVVKEHKPKLIITLGFSAIFGLIGHRWKKNFEGDSKWRGLQLPIKWRGWTIPDRDIKAWVCPTFNPEYVLEKLAEEKYQVETIWQQDIRNAISKLNEPLPIYKEPKIKYIEDLKILNEIKPNSISAFDYEATGLKPYAKGHKIVCIAIAVSENKVYTFMLPEKKKKRKPFLQYLSDETKRKIAQNLKYEDTWSEVILNTSVKGWDFDTMLASHVIDNRTGVTGLKFQTYVQFGIIDYDSEIAPYLKAKDANSLNRVLKFVKQPGGNKKLLKYCAYDSIYEFRLAVLQKKEFENLLPF